MMEQLPDGKSIGWMQAPPQWIFSHTLRFVGIVRIVIQDGEGFILINKGKPLTYYFKHGRIELRGNAALDYFNSNPTIEFNLSKYTPDEMALAMQICHIEDGETKTAPVPVAPAVPAEPPARAPPQPAAPPARPDTTAAPAPAAAPKPAPVPVRPFPEPEAEPEEEIPPEPVPAVPVPPVLEAPPAPPSVPLPAILDAEDIKIISQIKKLNGIVAISVFNDDRNIMLMGDVEIEPLLRIARSLLATTRKITPHLDWGQFVHMTLQIPEGNIIIADYRENYLCLLTTRTINIGHIRRILRDLQISEGG